MKKPEMQLYDALFREIYHRVIYIEIGDMAPIAEAVEVMEGATGVLAYGFMEEHACMTFLVLASARLTDDDLVLGPDVSEELCRFRFMDVENYLYLPEEALPVEVSAYEGVAATVSEYLEPQDEARRAMLDYEMIDLNRNLAYPEFVSLTLYDGKHSPEMVWARPVRIGDEGEFYGYIGHEPRQKYGLTTEDEIMFRAYDNGNGGIQLMWDGRKPEDQETYS